MRAIHDNILTTVGRTPIVRLGRIGKGLKATLLAKVEYTNPGGSVKDRVAVRMIEDAEKKGLIRPGGVIVEATAGNTGVGLAMVAAIKGYRCICVLPDKMSEDKISLLRAYGAEVVVTPTSVPPDSPESYNGVADRLSREIPGAYRPNQFANPTNPDAHYQTTGPGDMGRHRRERRRVRGRDGHRRDDLGNGPLSQGEEARASSWSARTPRARSSPATARSPTRWRESGRTSSRKPSTAGWWTR